MSLKLAQLDQQSTVKLKKKKPTNLKIVSNIAANLFENGELTLSTLEQFEDVLQQPASNCSLQLIYFLDKKWDI